MDKSRIAKEIFNEGAEVYEEKYMELELYHDVLNAFCTLLPRENAHILDAACGPGNISRYLSSQLADCSILGIDLAPNMLTLAQKHVPKGVFKEMDCRAISQLGQQFDGIICGFGLPYLSNDEAVQFIKDARQLLRPEGVLYLSTMEGKYSQSGFKKPGSGTTKKLFIYYHEFDYLHSALQENGFEVVLINRKKMNEQADTDLIFIGKAKCK